MEIEDEEGRSTTSQIHLLPQSSSSASGDGTKDNLGYILMEVDGNTDIFIETSSKFAITWNTYITIRQILEDKGISPCCVVVKVLVLLLQ